MDTPAAGAPGAQKNIDIGNALKIVRPTLGDNAGIAARLAERAIGGGVVDVWTNGAQGDISPHGESSKTPDGQDLTVHGSYELDVPPSFLDAHGRIDPTKGQLVATGGVDSSTGLPLTTTFTAPADAGLVSPLTTLAQTLVRQSGLGEAAAAAQVRQALGLPADVNLYTFDPIARAHVNPPDVAS